MSDDSGVSPPGMLRRLGPGSRIAGYVIEEKVGSGGMAVVFRARDEALGRPTALKILAPALADDQEFRARFLRESRSVAAVEDPHIVPVYAAGDADGVLYLATRFVPGGDLAALLRRSGGVLEPDRAAAIVTQLAAALDAAHAAGLVHRDVKPGNVLIDATPGRPEHAYLSDFGLSKSVSSETALTATGTFLGTPDYCAPEQVAGQSPVSPQTDQYSLACVAFRMLTGRVPYPRTEPLATLFAHLHDAVPAPTAVQPGLPRAVDAVLARAMARDPAGRYGSCGEFASALRAAAVPPVAAPTVVARLPPGAVRNRRRRRTPVIAGAAALIIAGGAWAGLTLSSSPGAASAATVGAQRITVPELDSYVTALKKAVKAYPGETMAVSSAGMPAAVLSWLIRFAVMDRVAAGAGITVTQAQDQQGLSSLSAIASEAGYKDTSELLVANGLPPSLFSRFGQYEAQELAYARKENGGKTPSTTAQETAFTAAFSHAECTAAKVLDISLASQYGRLDYQSYSVVPTTTSSPSVSATATSTAGLAPSC